MHELEGRVDVGGYEGGLVVVAVVIVVDVGGAGHVTAARAGVVAIVDTVVVVVRIFCVECWSWRGARSVGDERTKTAGGARRVGGDEVRSAARAVVLNEVFVIVVTHLEGEDKGVCAVHISGEGVEPTHHPGAE